MLQNNTKYLKNLPESNVYWESSSSRTHFQDTSCLCDMEAEIMLDRQVIISSEQRVFTWF